MITLPTLPIRTVGIIYAGGHGSRLWPISTPTSPKQVNPAFSKHTLVVDAYDRARKLFDADKILLVVTQELYPTIRELLPLPDRQYIIQPDLEDTAASMAIAAMTVETLFPGSIAVTMYSDHVIEQMDQFVDEITKALAFASTTDQIIAIGTTPLEPNTQFGYIKKGIKISDNMFTIDAFDEKPDSKKANEYYASGTYVWNTGMYIWKPVVILQYLKEISRETYDLLLNLRSETNSSAFYAAVSDFHSHVIKQPFELLLGDKAKTMVLFVANFPWRDLGNWKAVYDASEKDDNGNATINSPNTNVYKIDSNGCLIMAKQQTVSLIGVKDLIIVQTDNELLILAKDQSCKVKNMSKLVQNSKLIK